ncbi:MAG TPA: hypothetical protein VK747_01705, partial [Blastocatellia bacterium]|nr:hypothetical protein [Blastocatellia bacterium]
PVPNRRNGQAKCLNELERREPYCNTLVMPKEDPVKAGAASKITEDVRKFAAEQKSPTKKRSNGAWNKDKQVDTPKLCPLPFALLLWHR